MAKGMGKCPKGHDLAVISYRTGNSGAPKRIFDLAYCVECKGLYSMKVDSVLVPNLQSSESKK